MELRWWLRSCNVDSPQRTFVWTKHPLNVLSIDQIDSFFSFPSMLASPHPALLPSLCSPSSSHVRPRSSLSSSSFAAGSLLALSKYSKFLPSLIGQVHGLTQCCRCTDLRVGPHDSW